MSHWFDKFTVNFVPETPEEKLEADKMEVANMLDMPEWEWLKARLRDERMSYSEIFDLVANNS